MADTRVATNQRAPLVSRTNGRTDPAERLDHMTSWNIEGDYMETCNCTMLCPCISSNMEASPTEGDCKAALAMRINRGEKDGLKLDGLSFIVILKSPGPMIEGNIKVGLIVDDKATSEQVDAIIAIASGASGGPMALMAPLVSEFAGVEQRPITFAQDGLNYAVTAGNLLDQAVMGVPSMADPSVPISIDNTGHPANSRLAIARAVNSMFNAFGITWKDQTGTRNGHFAPFSWAG